MTSNEDFNGPDMNSRLRGAETGEADPACQAYLDSMAAKAATETCATGQYARLMVICFKTQDVLAKTSASTLAGICCKMKWLIMIENWQEDDGHVESQFGFSILHDLERLTGGPS